MKEVLKYKSQVVSLFISIGVVIFTVVFINDYLKIRQWMFKNFEEPKIGWPHFSDFHITLATAFISLVSNLILN